MGDLIYADTPESSRWMRGDLRARAWESVVAGARNCGVKDGIIGGGGGCCLAALYGIAEDAASKVGLLAPETECGRSTCSCTRSISLECITDAERCAGRGIAAFLVKGTLM